MLNEIYHRSLASVANINVVVVVVDGGIGVSIIIKMVSDFFSDVWNVSKKLYLGIQQ